MGHLTFSCLWDGGRVMLLDRVIGTTLMTDLVLWLGKHLRNKHACLSIPVWQTHAKSKATIQTTDRVHVLMESEVY